MFFNEAVIWISFIKTLQLNPIGKRLFSKVKFAAYRKLKILEITWV